MDRLQQLKQTKEELTNKIEHYYERNGQMYTGDRSFDELQYDLNQTIFDIVFEYVENNMDI